MSEAPLKHRTLAAAVLDRLRENILTGQHPAGEPLRQDAVAAAYGVSRIPVREALLQLEAEGFVTIVPHKGAVVSPLSEEEVGDVFDLRALLEPRLFRQAIPRLSAADHAALAEVHGRFVAAIAARDVARWGQINAEFHARLYAPAPLPRTQAIVAALLQTSDRYTRLQLSSPAAMARAEREHAALMEMAAAGRVEPACALLAGHIADVRRDLLAVLRHAGGAASLRP